MKRFFSISLCLAAVVLLGSCAGGAKKSASEQTDVDSALVKEAAAIDSLKAERALVKLEQLPAEPVFDIITNYGIIKVKLYADTPKHRENFAKLALSGFYDGILFHRVINGFMIQGGDPLTKDPEQAPRYGTGGPGYTVPAEFVAEHRHIKGALAAARKGDMANPMKESSGSQFYLVQDPVACAQLDGDYTVFGETVEGIDVIDKIAAVEVDGRDRPLQEVKILVVKADPELNQAAE